MMCSNLMAVQREGSTYTFLNSGRYTQVRKTAAIKFNKKYKKENQICYH